MSDLAPKWVRLAPDPDGTNLELFKINCLLILARWAWTENCDLKNPTFATFWCNSGPIGGPIWHACFCPQTTGSSRSYRDRISRWLRTSARNKEHSEPLSLLQTGTKSYHQQQSICDSNCPNTNCDQIYSNCTKTKCGNVDSNCLNTKKCFSLRSILRRILVFLFIILCVSLCVILWKPELLNSLEAYLLSWFGVQLELPPQSYFYTVWIQLLYKFQLFLRSWLPIERTAWICSLFSDFHKVEITDAKKYQNWAFFFKSIIFAEW